MARGLRRAREGFCSGHAGRATNRRVKRPPRSRPGRLAGSRGRPDRRAVGAHDLGRPAPRDPEGISRQLDSDRRARSDRGEHRLRQFPAGAQPSQRSGSQTACVQPQRAATTTRQSPELRRRLRARARRTKVLRRRIVALTLGLFLALWGAISAAGYLGVYKTTQVSLLASTAASRSAGTKARAALASSAAATSSGSSAAGSAAATSASTTTTTTTVTPTAVTTSQS